jgi:hypothetical protein
MPFTPVVVFARSTASPQAWVLLLLNALIAGADTVEVTCYRMNEHGNDGAIHADASMSRCDVPTTVALDHRSMSSQCGSE